MLAMPGLAMPRNVRMSLVRCWNLSWGVRHGVVKKRSGEKRPPPQDIETHTLPLNLAVAVPKSSCCCHTVPRRIASTTRLQTLGPEVVVGHRSDGTRDKVTAFGNGLHLAQFQRILKSKRTVVVLTYLGC